MQDVIPFIVAMIMGLLVGVEREKAHPDEEGALGVRSFTLIALFGALAGWIEEPAVSAAAAVFALGLIAVGYVTSSRTGVRRPDAGLTTELAAAVVFFLGFAANRSIIIVSLLGPVVALLLFAKKPLHSFTGRIKASELEAFLLLTLMSVGILHLVPNEAIDPWGFFNPQKYGILVLALAIIEFAGYVAAKLFGHQRGSWLIGFLGGLVSSTAVTLSSAREARANPGLWRKSASSILASQIASLGALIVIVAVSSPNLALFIAGPVIFSSLVCGAALFLVQRGTSSDTGTVEVASPLDLANVIRLSLLLFFILSAVALTRKFLGEGATYVIVFLTGLFELHGISLATVNLYTQGGVEVETAARSILLAVGASLLAKIGMTWAIERSTLARFVTVVMTITYLGAGAILWLVMT